MPYGVLGLGYMVKRSHSIHLVAGVGAGGAGGADGADAADAAACSRAVGTPSLTVSPPY